VHSLSLFIWWAVLLAFLIPIAIHDWRTEIIPNWPLIAGVSLALVMWSWFAGLHGLWISASGLLIGLAVGIVGERLSLLRVGLWAMGDAKLIAMIGAFLGASGVVLVVVFACFAFCMVRLLGLMRQWNPFKAMPFAPALLFGSLALFVGQVLVISLQSGVL
jgi:prepilin signal peptidase PulO-like enzyme (type II secretory pathway)